MQLKKYILGLSLLFGLSAVAQEVKQYTNAAGKIGFLSATGDTVIQAQFDSADSHAFGYNFNPDCIVSKNKKHGLIDAKGKFIIPCLYDDIFRKTGAVNLYGIELNGKYGLADRFTGKVVLEPTYDSELHFSNGIAPIEKAGKFGLYSENGNKVLALPQWDGIGRIQEKLILVNQNGKYGFINLKGAIQIPILYDQADEYINRNGLVAVRKGTKWGYVNSKGREMTPFKYDRLFNFSEGTSVFMLNEKYGFLDESGKELIPAQYDDADNFFGGLAFVAQQKDTALKYALINKKGEFLTDYEFDYFENNLGEGFALVQKSEKYGLLNIDGKYMVPIACEREDIYDYFEFGHFTTIRVKFNEKMGVISFNGDTLVPFDYDYIENADYENDNVVLVGRGDKRGWYDVDKMREVIPLVYEEIMPYIYDEDWYVGVKCQDGQGIWDLKLQKELIPPKYESVYPDEYNYISNIRTFILTQNKKEGLWNAELGKEILAPIYANVYFLEQSMHWKKQYYVYMSNNQSFLCDLNGNQILPFAVNGDPMILEDRAQKKQYILVFSQEKELYGLYDFSGKEVLPSIYQEINEPNKGKIWVTIDGESQEIKLP